MADRAIVINMQALRDDDGGFDSRKDIANRVDAKSGAIAFKSDNDFKKANMARYQEILSTKAAKLPLDKILEWFPDEEILKADGFDDAIIGIDDTSMRLIYSINKCIIILLSEEDLTEEDALEHFHYNVKGSYVGEKTPIWCTDDL